MRNDLHAAIIARRYEILEYLIKETDGKLWNATARVWGDVKRAVRGPVWDQIRNRLWLLVRNSSKLDDSKLDDSYADEEIPS